MSDKPERRIVIAKLNEPIIDRQNAISVLKLDDGFRRSRVVTRWTNHIFVWSVTQKNKDKIEIYIGNGTDQMRHKEVTAQGLLDFLKGNYNEDYLLILWHPEIFQGKYYD